MSFLLFHSVCKGQKCINLLFHKRDERAETNGMFQKGALSVNYLYGNYIFASFTSIGCYCYHVPTSSKRTQNCLVLCIMIVRKHQAEVRLTNSEISMDGASCCKLEDCAFWNAEGNHCYVGVERGGGDNRTIIVKLFLWLMSHFSSNNFLRKRGVIINL